MNANARPTIGLIINGSSGVLEPQWAGIADKAQELDVDLVCFAGGTLRQSPSVDLSNSVYDLAGPENVDGLIIWSGGLNWHVSNEYMGKFCERYRPLPMVSVEVAFNGIPSLLMDDFQGMYLAIKHLIDVHGRTRIAFIKGPDGHLGARERYRAYERALSEHGLSVDPNLVVQGSFAKDSGEEAMRILLEKRHVRFNALASSNDAMAIGAMQVMEYHGMRVPEDVAIVNFDNSLESSAIPTPLTVVDAPFYALGQRAVETLMAQIAGKPVPEKEYIAPTLVVRRSCGCILQTMEKAVVPVVEIPSTPHLKKEADLFSEQQAAIIEAMKHALGPAPAGLSATWAKELWDTFFTDITRQNEGVFISALQKQLRRVLDNESDFYPWQDVLSALRRRVRPLMSCDSPSLVRAENLWQQGRILIVEMALQARSFRQLQFRTQTENLIAVTQALIATFDMDGLKVAIGRELPKLKIQNCYLSLYEEPGSPESARLILAYDENGVSQLPIEGKKFKPTSLAPNDILGETQHVTFMVLPLFFETELLGFMLIGIGTRIFFNLDLLRVQIGSALHGARLLQAHQRIEEQLTRSNTELAQSYQALKEHQEQLSKVKKE